MTVARSVLNHLSLHRRSIEFWHMQKSDQSGFLRPYSGRKNEENITVLAGAPFPAPHAICTLVSSLRSLVLPLSLPFGRLPRRLEDQWKWMQSCVEEFLLLRRYKNVLESHLSKNYGNGNTADNFTSAYTVDFKMQISHTVRLEITATPQAGSFFHCNTA